MNNESNGPELILLDFVEHDSIAALRYLIRKFEDNEATGMVFALKLRGKHEHPHFTGATGTLAANLLEGAGIAGVLHLQMVKNAGDDDDD